MVRLNDVILASKECTGFSAEFLNHKISLTESPGNGEDKWNGSFIEEPAEAIILSIKPE